MPESSEYRRGYAAGYAAGKRSAEKEEALSRSDKLYIECLGQALQHCGSWEVGEKKCSGIPDYSYLAKLFRD